MKTTRKIVKEMDARVEQLEKVQDTQMKGLAILGAATIIEYVVAPVISAGVNGVINSVKNRKAVRHDQEKLYEEVIIEKGEEEEGDE